jgi:hypothetical protein
MHQLTNPHSSLKFWSDSPEPQSLATDQLNNMRIEEKIADTELEVTLTEHAEFFWNSSTEA